MFINLQVIDMGNSQNQKMERQVRETALSFQLNAEFTQIEFSHRLNQLFPKSDYTWMQLSGLMKSCNYLKKCGTTSVNGFPYKHSMALYKRTMGF